MVLTTTEVQPFRTIRPHTKSRQGCLNCKARRVKCQETRPHPCYNCTSRGKECVYPSNNQLSRRRHDAREKSSSRKEAPGHDYFNSASDPGSSEMELRPLSYRSPDTFSGEDLRFFHHFLVAAYPHLPFQSEELWKTSLPAYAHKCPHLMHAILCLGASHLSLVSPRGDNYTRLAAEHRGKALKHLGTALATVDQCLKTELDLILASTYALTFQASYMADGLVDFAFMVRGCGILTRHIVDQYQRSEMFDLLMPNDIYAHIWPRLSPEPFHSAEMLDTCIQTLEGIQPLLQKPADRVVYDTILNTYRALQISARQAFIAMTFVYGGWDHMSHQEFMDFLDSRNHVSSLLLLHFVAIIIMMRPVFSMLRPSLMETPKDGLANHQWGINIYERLPAEFRPLVEWQHRFIIMDKAFIEKEGAQYAIGHRNETWEL